MTRTLGRRLAEPLSNPWHTYHITFYVYLYNTQTTFPVKLTYQAKCKIFKTAIVHTFFLLLRPRLVIFCQHFRNLSRKAVPLKRRKSVTQRTARLSANP